MSARAGRRMPRARSTLSQATPTSHGRWPRSLEPAVCSPRTVFDEHLQASIDGFASLGVPYEEARSRLCYGERLRRAGRRVEARRQLRDALVTFERLRTDPYTERTRAELRASGETLRTREPGTPLDELTPQELQVATLAAAGLTNKEAAARLFLSVKTIEAHLHRTYRKLGVRSRAELAPLLAERDAST